MNIKSGRITVFIRIGVSALLVGLLIYLMRGEYKDILLTLRSVHLPLFLAAFGLFIVAISIASIRLKLIVEMQELTISMREAVSLSFIGYFFNNFLPTSIGGDVVKGFYLSHKMKQRMGAYISVLVDRIIGLFTMIFMACIALLMADHNVLNAPLRNGILAITALALVFTLVMANKTIARKLSFILSLFRPLEERLRSAYNIFHNYKNDKLFLAKALALSVIGQIVYFTSVGMAVSSLGAHIDLSSLFLIAPIVCVVALLPSINGLGVREGATVMLFGPLIGKQNSFALGILVLLILIMTSVIGGIIYGLSPQFKIDFKEAMKGDGL